jgi:hypothetical protein
MIHNRVPRQRREFALNFSVHRHTRSRRGFLSPLLLVAMTGLDARLLARI